jgi:hypothetical protein
VEVASRALWQTSKGTRATTRSLSRRRAFHQLAVILSLLWKTARTLARTMPNVTARASLNVRLLSGRGLHASMVPPANPECRILLSTRYEQTASPGDEMAGQASLIGLGTL